ncbi:unnamed protein product [Rotaria sordida]|uniref:Uncharacterized protein n=1 Tax=Rotaria sordida TaxID=392033 RepID=A0A814X9E7_9BILA|nr:unnamed protein product [Rotaria sordida]CAF3970004.1 unnamed protein product [Rotaria sordida]
MSNNDNTMVTNSQSSEMSANEIFNDDTSTKMRNLWDLLNSLDWDKKYQVIEFSLISDVSQVLKDPPPRTSTVSEPDNITKI